MRQGRCSRISIFNEDIERINMELGEVDNIKVRAMLLDKKRLLQQMLDELPHTLSEIPLYEPFRNDPFSRYYRVYLGTIDSWVCKPTSMEPRRSYVQQVVFSIERGSESDGDIAKSLPVTVEPVEDLGDEWLLSGKYDKQRHDRYEKDLDTTLRFTVDNFNHLVDLEWVEPDHDSYWREVSIPEKILTQYAQAIKCNDPTFISKYFDIPKNTRLLTRKVKYPDRRVMEIRLDSGDNECYLTARLLDRNGKELASQCYLSWPWVFTLDYDWRWYKACCRADKEQPRITHSSRDNIKGESENNESTTN